MHSSINLYVCVFSLYACHCACACGIRSHLYHYMPVHFVGSRYFLWKATVVAVAPWSEAWRLHHLRQRCTFVGRHELQHQGRLQIVRHILCQGWSCNHLQPILGSRSSHDPPELASCVALLAARRAARNRERRDSMTVGWMAPWVSRGFWPRPRCPLCNPKNASGRSVWSIHGGAY